MAALTGQTKASTYDSLLHITDNGPADGTLKAVADGVGNDTALQVSTAAVHSAGTLSSVSADGTNSARFAGASGAARIYGYFDATLGTTVNALNVAGDTYIPLSLDGSSVRCMASGNLVGLFTATGLNATAIGATTPAAGVFTTLSASSGINSTNVGAGTPGTGAFTTLTGTAVSATTSFTAPFVKQSSGNIRLTADFTTSSDTLVDTDLVVTLASGETYSFEAQLFGTVSGNAGYKIGLGGTVTATNIVGVTGIKPSSNDPSTTSFASIATSGLGYAVAVSMDEGWIRGTITVNTGGTLLVQFARSAPFATTTLKRGSYLRVTQY
jgi:hypothetical protein